MPAATPHAIVERGYTLEEAWTLWHDRYEVPDGSDGSGSDGNDDGSDADDGAG